MARASGEQNLSSAEVTSPPRGTYLATLSLGALGIVYGDIGTSPLYAIRECFHGPHAVAPTPDHILGVLSLVFWSLVIVISIKYLVFVMRADNRGEGGILALTALVSPGGRNGRRRTALIATGLFGAALFYGDGMITPAISVLSAIEGLEVATPVFTPYVVPITIVILIGLFVLQKKGTAGIGALFGPITMVWFATLAILGISQIIREPGVLAAINPLYGIRFFAEGGLPSFLVLGSVFLVVTGGEALYADMGHFGTLPIRLTWFSLVMPSLLLNYFGQGALLLHSPEAAQNPFYRMGPAWSLYPMVVLAAAATVIASQAVISGVYSLTRQAIQLGYSPRMQIDHKSEREIGQIYMPGVNWMLMIACILLVAGFRSSSNLAAAYGIAVTTTMVITTGLLFVVARERWKWRLSSTLLLVSLFLVVDLAFFGANVVKIAHGGWFPLAIAATVFTLMSTWKTGRKLLDTQLREGALPLDTFAASLAQRPLTRVPGTAVFMHRRPGLTPSALLHSIKHYKVVHEQLVLVSIVTEEIPHVSDEGRIEVTDLGNGIFQMQIRYGFAEDPDVPAALAKTEMYGLDFDPSKTSYFLGRETLLATEKPGMAIWREHLFIWMSKNARGATYFFRLPPNRVVELGAQIEI